MGKGRIVAGVVTFALLGAAIGYVVATAYITFARYGIAASIDFMMLARDYLPMRTVRPDQFKIVNILIGGFTLGGLLLSAVLMNDVLTKFGATHWQTKRELRKNGFLGKPGRGFILGKLGSPNSKAALISSTAFPHAMVVAPTGRGKTSGFSIPNLLTFNGSVVALDVKGELFEETSRHRASQGDRVFRFAPTDWSGTPSHRYNPLLRISQLESPAQQQMELQLLATLFLETKSEKAEGLLKGGINLFTACGLFAFELGKPTLGEVYRLATAGGDKPKTYRSYAGKVRNVNASRMFMNLSGINNDTLTSYLSLLETSGLDQWSNPAVDEATSESDFDFRDIRKKPFSVYLVVQPLMVKPMAALIRLFFSDLLASLMDHYPGKDEPWPVMIMLDEFNRIGKMPIITDAFEMLRSYNGHLAVITQTIPALDEIYGENTRRAMQGSAGVKLYLTPSEGKTIEELSEAVGTTTKRVVTRSRAIGGNPFEGRSTSERTEESALLPPDEVRRMPLDDIVMVIDAQMPIRAKRIKYYEDRTFKKIHAAQTGALPYPTDADANQRLARKVEALSTKLDTLAGTRGSTQNPETGDAATSRGRGGGVEERPGAAAKPEPSIALAQATPATGPVGVSARKAARLNGVIADMERQEGSRMAQRESAGATIHAPETPTAADEAAIEVATNSLAALIAKAERTGGGEATAAE